MTYYPPVPVTHPDLIGCVVRTAAEGVPVAAIARAMKIPYDRVLYYLQRAKKLGAITEIPRPDWPPGPERVRASAIQPSRGQLNQSTTVNRPAEDMEFLCRHIFRLTNLEAGFLVVLLRCLFAEKEKLHAVIELQRATRPLRPLQQEVTDVKMVDVMICKLRKKLNAIDPTCIVRTSWGKGYFLDQTVKDGIYRMLDSGVQDLSHETETRCTAAAAQLPAGGQPAAGPGGRVGGLPARP